MRLSLSLLVLVCLKKLCGVEGGFCSYFQPSIHEQFEMSPYVARLNYTGDKIDLACSLRLYNTTASANELVDSLSSYQVLEVFKGDDLIEKDTNIPFFLTTPEGLFVPDIDPKFNLEAEGFLVFFAPLRECYDQLGGPYTYFDDYEPTPFSTSVCLSANTVWSEVSEQDQLFLRSGGILTPSGMPSKAPTVAPVAVTRVPSTPAPVIPGTVGGAAPTTPMPIVQPTPAPTRCWDACSAGSGKQWVCKREFGCEGCISDFVCPLLCWRCSDETTPFGGLDCDCSA
jgi:hypothetical protein